jgi:hypothetical protein
MTFVSPLFLWALAAVSVPIIIHLFNFRRYKKVYFTNVKFLKELQHESKSKSRLKEILVLIARCMAIACLVLAFAQPVIPEKNNAIRHTGANAIGIYLDNSFSMENVNKQGPLLELAKTRAKELIQVFDNADKFQIITNDFEGRHQRFHTKEDALNIVDDIKISSSVRTLNEVIKRQTDFINSSNYQNKKIYIFSDAQKTTFDLDKLQPDTSIRTTLIPLQANQVNNVFIDTCWFETPVQQKGFIQKLHAKIVNSGKNTIDVGSAKLVLGGAQVAISSFSLEPDTHTEIVFTFECKQNGFNYGSVKIEDYPVTFDDELFFAFNSRINISVCLINGKDQPSANAFSSLFSNDSLFKFISFSEQTIDYGAFRSSDVIILNQLEELSSGMISELLKFTSQGGALVIVPSIKAGAISYNNASAALRLPSLGVLDSSQTKTEKIELGSGFFTGVFDKVEERLNLPLVTQHYKLLSGNKNDFEPILLLQNSDPLFGMTRLNNAQVYLFSTPLTETATNFNKHALFVPVFYRISFNSLKSSVLFYPVNTNMIINLKNDVNIGEQPPHIKDLENKTDIIPEMRSINNSLFLYTRAQIKTPGFYKVERNQQALLPLAFNYSRRESNLAVLDISEITKIIADKGWKQVTLIEDSQSDISKQIMLGAEGKKLWKLFIILALIFIATEVLLLRLLK